MKQEILAPLFGSKTEARLLRFLFGHPAGEFRLGEIARRIRANYNTTSGYIQQFLDIGLVKKSSKGKKGLISLNPDFKLYYELRELILKSFPVGEEEVRKKLRRLGKVRLAILSGVFLNLDNIQVDFFLVADDVKKKEFEEFLKELEADVGRDINYTLMDTSEFTYRYNIYDRFVRNVFRKPHIKIIDDLKI